MSIKLLSKEVINQIAAGEVVERPASVLKETIENSLDAGATSIKVTITNAGLDEITIEDNGKGISFTDVKLVFEQHATSKVTSIDDFDTLATNGFRGEALASIAEVSEKAIISSYKKGDIAFTYTYSEEPKKTKQDTAGTTITIKGLFNRVPARKKFLKSEKTEIRHITDVFKNLALSYHTVQFELVIDGKTTYKLPSAKKKLDRIYEIWDLQRVKNVSQAKADMPELQLEGFFGNSKIAYSAKGDQYVFINGRYVSSSIAHAAVRNGYSGFIPSAKKPTFILFLQIDPKHLDVNIHPRKLEVKFDNEQDIFLKVLNFTKKHLESSNLITKEDIDDSRQALKTFNRYVSERKSTTSPTPTRFENRSAKKDVISKSIEFTKQLGISQKNVPITAAEIKPNKMYYTFIGLAFDSFYLFEIGDKLGVIDIKDALYKKTLAYYEKTDKVSTQTLLLPEVIDLDSKSFTALKNNLEELTKLGILLEPFGLKGFQLIEVPEILSQRSWGDLIESLADTKPEDYKEIIARKSSDLESYSLESKALRETLLDFCIRNNNFKSVTKENFESLI